MIASSTSAEYVCLVETRTRTSATVHKPCIKARLLALHQNGRQPCPQNSRSWEAAGHTVRHDHSQVPQCAICSTTNRLQTLGEARASSRRLRLRHPRSATRLHQFWWSLSSARLRHDRRHKPVGSPRCNCEYTLSVQQSQLTDSQHVAFGRLPRRQHLAARLETTRRQEVACLCLAPWWLATDG